MRSYSRGRLYSRMRRSDLDLVDATDLGLERVQGCVVRRGEPAKARRNERRGGERRVLEW
jgi:hypothetical protein